MTRQRLGFLVAGVAVVALLMGAPTSATARIWFFGRTHVTHTSALMLQDGTLTPRYQVAYVGDRLEPATCVMVIRDAETNQLTATAVAPGSCRP
ncbi:MAG: hypothetical protein AB7I13_00730 [Vicinamibacterales bacterium]